MGFDVFCLFFFNMFDRTSCDDTPYPVPVISILKQKDPFNSSPQPINPSHPLSTTAAPVVFFEKQSITNIAERRYDRLIGASITPEGDTPTVHQWNYMGNTVLGKKNGHLMETNGINYNLWFGWFGIWDCTIANIYPYGSSRIFWSTTGVWWRFGG